MGALLVRAIAIVHENHVAEASEHLRPEPSRDPNKGVRTFRERPADVPADVLSRFLNVFALDLTSVFAVYARPAMACALLSRGSFLGIVLHCELFNPRFKGVAFHAIVE
ncbi:MAG: hypothetical protein HC897_19435 [Thermoanaerobaculia bacterium]|nr:hypothetical protein [Thermoanaerobaculia bacterium]